MLQYILEIIIWTVVFYIVWEIIKTLIYKFVISPETLKEIKSVGYIRIGKYIKSKTRSENKKAK